MGTHLLTDLDFQLFEEMLAIESTSGQERRLADFLVQRFDAGCSYISITPDDAGADDPVNLYFQWGKPQIVFCSHLDTVPPYIAPAFDGDTITGRGTCDAKGQVFSMFQACKRLAQSGESGFGLLLLHGEETGSYGAKEFRQHPGAKYVVVGEPTDNAMASASKGTKAFEIEITGRSFHSGYPHMGDSAIERFVDFALALRSMQFPNDPILGATTYNIGRLLSDNPQNILSDRCACRVYFRTTFASDAMVGEKMAALASDHVHVKALGGDSPSRYLTLPGFPTTVVAFGSDAPQLTNFEHKILCGPGSILVAHRPEEFITIADIEQAIENYIKIYYVLKNETPSVKK